jgi:hypothetical protein
MSSKKQQTKRIPAHAPNALIAFDDYEHIYKGDTNAKKSQTPCQRSAEVLPPSVLKIVGKFIKKQPKTINTIPSIVRSIQSFGNLSIK